MLVGILSTIGGVLFFVGVLAALVVFLRGVFSIQAGPGATREDRKIKGRAMLKQVMPNVLKCFAVATVGLIVIIVAAAI